MNKQDAYKALNQKNLMDMFDALHTFLGNRATSAAGLVIGSSSKAKVKIANTVSYLIDGVFKSKTTAEVAFTATTHDIPADADTVQEAVYVMTLKADGTPTLTMGDIATGAGNALYPDFADLPVGEAVVGAVRIAVDAGSTDFDASTDELDESHLTVAYEDLGILFPRFDQVQ